MNSFWQSAVWKNRLTYMNRSCFYTAITAAGCEILGMTQDEQISLPRTTGVFLPLWNIFKHLNANAPNWSTANTNEAAGVAMLVGTVALLNWGLSALVSPLFSNNQFRAYLFSSIAFCILFHKLASRIQPTHNAPDQGQKSFTPRLT